MLAHSVNLLRSPQNAENLDCCLLVVVKGKDVYPQAQTEDGFVGGERQRQHVNESRLAFHSDQGATDLIALLSLNKAKSGGASKWVSAVAIHNELLRRGRKVCLLLWLPGH